LFAVYVYYYLVIFQIYQPYINSQQSFIIVLMNIGKPG